MRTTDLKRSSRGGAAADVGLVRLDVQETVVEGGRPVFPLPAGHEGNNPHHLETEED